MRLFVLIDNEELVASSAIRDKLIDMATSRHLNVNMKPLFFNQVVRTDEGEVQIKEVEFI